MAVNQKQIAEKLGVSISLVSRVLSGNARDIGIAEETIEKVMTVADKLGYVPNVAARTLKGKASNTIGVVVYDFQDPFFGSTIEQLQSVVHDRGYSLVLTGFQGRQPNESDLAPLHKHVIDGLVVLGSSDRSDWLENFTRLPVVRVGRGGADERSVCITVDEEDAARQLLDHLADRNVERYIFIGSDLYSHGVRYAALEGVAATMGLPLERIAISDRGFSAGFKACNSLLPQVNDFTALVCATDMIALGALHALHDAGAHCPVTGFDDIPAASQFIPALTTIRQPLAELVKRALEAVRTPAEPAKVFVKGELVVRKSA